ncbi:MAG: SDR family oxidoreductase [Paludibacter sp.]|nr:SDR family oxidoreductase [Paludibacter sp.]
MKIVVVGASGKTGRLVIEEAVMAGYEVIAYVRIKESVKLVHPGLTIVEGQLNEKDKLKSVLAGADVCVSTLGGASLTKHSRAIVEGIDTIVALLEELKVKRFIYMSSIGAGTSRYFMPQPIRFFIADLLLRVPLADHTKKENRIMKSQLDWTILRPGGLTDGAKSDTLKHGSESFIMKGNQTVSRASVAAFIVNQFTDSAYLKKCVWLIE